MSCYSADLLLREYSRVRGESGKKKFTYKDMKKVYSIIIFEESSAEFRAEKLNGSYIHHGKTAFDTGLSLELLQEYYLISLDVFRERNYTKDNSRIYENSAGAGKDSLDAWLSLLAVSGMDEVDEVIRRYPWMEEIYREMASYLHRPKEVLGMFSEALRILDQNTVEYMVDEMREEIKSKDKQLAAKDIQIKANAKQLAGKDREIERLRALIKKQDSKGE